MVCVAEQVSAVLPASRPGWLMGTGWSGCRPALVSPAEAVSGSRSARTNSGRGHRKWRDTSTESCFHWHWDWGVCVRACKCVSVFSADRLTDCRSRWCMHDLSHSCLWKQHFSGQRKVTDRKWWPVWMNRTNRRPEKGGTFQRSFQAD